MEYLIQYITIKNEEMELSPFAQFSLTSETNLNHTCILEYDVLFLKNRISEYNYD